MSASAESRVTISVVSHGHRETVEALLGSIGRFEDASRLDVVLTDNLGTDLPEFAHSPWRSLVMLRNEHPLGYAENQNAAFRVSKSPFFCIVNPDVLFVEPVLEALLKLMQESGADIAAPLIRDSQGRLQDSFRGLPTPWELVRRRTTGVTFAPAFAPGEVLRPDWIAGMFLLARSDAFASLGGFDERYRLYFEDVDLCTRARLAGYRLAVATGIRLEHDPAHASRRPGQHLLWHTRSALRFFISPVYRRARHLPPHA